MYMCAYAFDSVSPFKPPSQTYSSHLIAGLVFNIEDLCTSIRLEHPSSKRIKSSDSI